MPYSLEIMGQARRHKEKKTWDDLIEISVQKSGQCYSITTQVYTIISIFLFLCILQFMILTISVFVWICSPHCERNSAHIVRRFPTSFRFALDIVAHNLLTIWKAKAKKKKTSLKVFSPRPLAMMSLYNSNVT